jgi:uncharacterized protein YegP (UPF0339 family)
MARAKFEIYEDAVGEHRWRVTAGNGEIIGASTEGYVNVEDCVRNALMLGIAICQLHAEERLQ